MNSAMTKVYAAADNQQQVMMYDGRVGAAICLLAREFLRQLPLNYVPPPMAFFWGPPTSGPPSDRNPSIGAYTFRSLNQHGVTDADRAEAAWRAGVVAEKVRQRINVSQRDLEKGLFMVGYKVWP